MISWRKHYKNVLLAVSLLLTTSASIYAQDLKGDAKKGQTLFKTNCTACHALDKQVVGPALGGVVEKVKKEQNLGVDWFQKWIKDNKALRASGDKYANELFNKYNKVEMTQFPSLSEQDIADILEYTTNPPKEEPVAEDAANSPEAQKAAQEEKNLSSIILVSLVSIAGLLLWILLKLSQLVKLQRKSDEISELDATRIHSVGEFYNKYQTFGKTVMGLLAVLALYGIWNWLMWVGVYKGYQPDQPIYFSHKIHAGENKIDCQLCHSGAKYGKVSEIPSVNVCMNCHKGISEYKGKYIEEGKDRAFYTAQIKKIYEAAGWDEASQTYTGKTKPIAWVRIHNMPDFVYFNHSQHVVAGEQTIMKAKKVDVVCKACHGQVPEMDKLQMANNFTMGWCIECHRTTEVDMTNDYNKEYYQKLHDKLKKQYGKDTKITVDAIGGLECGKCHY
ncbi:c-type cytochrome [Cloacibacterium sp.]|uniref:c-type cytochrome n=1 Tax=Cloacibacterium sp. TaxID=1913682 RepID=UPI0039E67014